MWPWSEIPQALNIDGHSALKPRNMRFSLTRLGWGLIIVCMLLWVMAVNYQVNVAYALLFWLAGILIFGAVAEVRQLTGLVLEIIPAAEYFADTEVALTLRACDECKRRRWLWLQAAQQFPENAEDWKLWRITAENTDFIWKLPPQPRGILPALTLTGVSMAPFGLLMVETQWEFTGEIVIFPAPLMHEIPPPTTRSNEQNNLISLDGQDPAYLLPHHYTSPLRQIAWKHYAKSGQLLDKYFDKNTSKIEPRLISYRDYPQSVSKERLASMLCYRVLEAEARNEDYILELPQNRYDSTTVQRLQCLIALGVW